MVREISAGPEGDAARLAMQTKMFKNIKTPDLLPELVAWDLGAGETSVIAYSLANPGWVAILDDGAGRKCANTFGIPIKGTLAVIIMAKRGLIPSAARILHEAQEVGLHLDNKLIRNVLRHSVGEEF